MYYGSLKEHIILLGILLLIILLIVIASFIYYHYCIRKGIKPSDSMVIDPLYKLALKIFKRK